MCTNDIHYYIYKGTVAIHTFKTRKKKGIAWDHNSYKKYNKIMHWKCEAFLKPCNKTCVNTNWSCPLQPFSVPFHDLFHTPDLQVQYTQPSHSGSSGSFVFFFWTCMLYNILDLPVSSPLISCTRPRLSNQNQTQLVAGTCNELSSLHHMTRVRPNFIE